ncbi:MAG: hypothetical protein SP4CHLAM5_11760 [Chlamydiia bacterium]|nr:hypothetical protein [Chlamydiia bacterium]MCH9619031.1 hypothetical protein [Chlamydiia bacterium]MCH9624377.1 hypothetical protein [Chlamydiia bacterium]
MANVSDTTNLDKLPSSEVVNAASTGNSTDKADTSKKGAAVLLSTLSDVVKSAEKSTHHAHAIVDLAAEQAIDNLENTEETDTSDQDTSDSSSNSDDSGDSSLYESDSDHSDCLMKLTMAGISTTSSKNKEIDATSKAGAELSEVTANVAKQEAANIKEFYTDGQTAGGDGELKITDNQFKGGGISAAGSAEQPILMNILQYMQSEASQVNNDMGNVAAIPGTTMQGETQSVTSAQSAAAGAGQAESTIGGQIGSWASI